MKTKYIAKRRKVGGFTLLELLVVVGILAIIAGAIITAYDGFQRRAALQTASNTVGSMTNTIRTYQTTSDELPNNVESLISATITTAAAASGDYNITAASAMELNGFLDTELASNLSSQALTAAQVTNLGNAGITRVRYIDSVGDADELAAPAALVLDSNINTLGYKRRPAVQSIYAPPIPVNDNNPNLGGYVDLTDTITNGLTTWAPITNQEFAVWGGQNPTTPTANFNNTAVGGEATGVLVAFGIGKESSVVGGGSNGGNTARLASAPFYKAFSDPYIYNHYIMLVDVAQSPAEFVAIIDPNGNTIDDGVSE